MQERLAVIRYEDGAQFTESQKIPGDFSALTRQKDDGTNRLGQVTFRDPTEGDLANLLPPGTHSHRHDPRAQERADAGRLAAELIVAAAAELARRAAPHVKLWLREQAIPAAQQGWKRLRGRRHTGGGTDIVEPSSVKASAAASGSDAVVASPAAEQVDMTSAEAQARFAALVAARLFADQQLRLLNAARITDEDDQPALAGAPQLPTTKQLVDSIRLQIEADRSLRFDDLLNPLSMMLDRAMDRTAAPLPREQATVDEL
ncbi:hypothetical protein ACFWDK_09305 [Micromonospora chalcea]